MRCRHCSRPDAVPPSQLCSACLQAGIRTPQPRGRCYCPQPDAIGRNLDQCARCGRRIVHRIRR